MSDKELYENLKKNFDYNEQRKMLVNAIYDYYFKGNDVKKALTDMIDELIDLENAEKTMIEELAPSIEARNN